MTGREKLLVGVSVSAIVLAVIAGVRCFIEAL